MTFHRRGGPRRGRYPYRPLIVRPPPIEPATLGSVPGSGQGQPSDVAAIVTLLGGNANVIAFRDVRFPMTLSGVNVVSVPDIRGPSFGLPLAVAAGGSSSHLTLVGTNPSNFLIVGDGSGTASALISAQDARYDLIAGTLTVFYGGKLLDTGSWAGVYGPAGVGGVGGLMASANTGALALFTQPVTTTSQPNRGRRSLDSRIRSVAAWRNPAAACGIVSIPSVIFTAVPQLPTAGAGQYTENIGALIDGIIPAPFQMRYQIIMKGIATLSQILGVRSWAQAVHNDQSDSQYFVTWDGDSIAQTFKGTDESQGYDTVALQDSRLVSLFSDVNIGVEAQTLAQCVTNYNVNNTGTYSTVSGAGAYARAGRTLDIVHQNAVTNDIIGGASAASIIASSQAYAQLVHAQGRKYIQATCLPRSDFTAGMITIQGQVNTYFMNNIGGPNQPDAVDLRVTDATMGLQANTTNATLYVDGVHPTTPLGHSLVAPYAANAIASLLPH